MVTLLAHEWLAKTGGSENVFEQIRLALPSARSVCLWNDDPTRFAGVAETWLARSPLRGKKAASLPFMDAAWRRVDLDDVDRVVVSSHAFAHHLASRAARRGLDSYCYVHSPARYLWVPDLDARGQHLSARLARSPLRRFDRARADSQVSYAANSRFVAQRIADAWHVPARVIYPPVDVVGVLRDRDGDTLSSAEQDEVGHLPEGYVLGASRFVPYKRVEAAIGVGEALARPVVLVGEGPEESRIRQVAELSTVPVTFLGRVSDALLRVLYARASIFVFLAVEDFGIMPVEAMAAGTPVLVNREGGAAESVEILGGGLTVDPDSRAELLKAAESALSLDMTLVATRADDFSEESFRSRLQGWVAGG